MANTTEEFPLPGLAEPDGVLVPQPTSATQ
jgi:hypothetical protein